MQTLKLATSAATVAFDSMLILEVWMPSMALTLLVLQLHRKLTEHLVTYTRWNLYKRAHVVTDCSSTHFT